MTETFRRLQTLQSTIATHAREMAEANDAGLTPDFKGLNILLAAETDLKQTFAIAYEKRIAEEKEQAAKELARRQAEDAKRAR